MGSTAAPSLPPPTMACGFCRRRSATASDMSAAWIAWRLMPGSNAALADNLRAVFAGRARGSAAPARARRLSQLHARRDRFPEGGVGRRRPGAADVRDCAGAAGDAPGAPRGGTRHHPGHRPPRELGSRRGDDDPFPASAADHRRDAGGQSGGEPDPAADSRSARRRDPGGAAVARHASADPPGALAEPLRRAAGRSSFRTRPCRGHVPRTPGVVSSNAHRAGEPHRRAARALLHPPGRPRPVRRAARPSGRRAQRSPARRRHPVRRAGDRGPARRARSGPIPSAGITSTGTGMPSATNTSASTDLPWIRFRTWRSAAR